jgi:arylsulfatase A-like enzyme
MTRLARCFREEARRPRSAIAGLALLLAGCGVGARTPPHVVFVLIDTLRADHVSAWGNPEVSTPHIDRLVRRGVSFENAVSPSSWTLPAAASLLTGFYPAAHGATNMNVKISYRTPTAAERFAEAGYETAAFVSHHLVGTPYGFRRGFEHFDESNARGHRHVSSPSLTRLASLWLHERRRSGARAPFFLLAHYFDPHDEYLPHESYLRRPLPHDPETGGVAPIGLYEGEIRFTDRAIGDLIETLETLELLDESIVVLTADHGEAFGEHGFTGHAHKLHEELVHVPLALAYEGAPRGAVVPGAVSSVHILPTLLSLCGLDADGAPMQGEPILTGRSLPESGVAISELAWLPYEGEGGEARDARQGRFFQAVRAGRYKLLFDEARGWWELYDLEEDPGETRDLAGERPDLVAELRAPLLQKLAEGRRLGEEFGQIEPVVLSPALEEALRALGYVE